MRKLHTLLVLTYALLIGPSNAAGLEIEHISDHVSVFEIDGSRINVEIRDPELREKKDMLLAWVLYSSKTVHQYYGRFPVNQVEIELQVAAGHSVRFGQAFGGSLPSLRIVIGKEINPKMLRQDWILVHEMIHLAMADIPYAHRWWLEGLATYVESIARAQRGHLTEQFVWYDFITQMPRGLPQSDDQGLDKTPTWGRTYWGGAIFCLLADIEIRQKTRNQQSLRDALRGVLADGLSMQASATAMQVFESADRATGVDVLVPLYHQMKSDPFPIDLDALWEKLGIRLKDDSIQFNDDAPMAHIRKQLLKY